VNRSFDHLEVTIKIIEDYAIFGGSEFLKRHGASLANIIDTIVGNVNDKGLLTSLPIVDLLIQIFPLEAPPLISSALQKLIFISLSQDDGQNPSRTAVRASSGAILARLLVMNTNFSAKLLSEPPLLASIQQAGIAVNNNLLISLIDMWIDKVHPPLLICCFLCKLGISFWLLRYLHHSMPVIILLAGDVPFVYII